MQGRCLCRAVSVTIKNPSALPGLELCHCTNCRQSTGALTGTFLLVEKSNFELEGEEHVKMYKGESEAGNALAWYWCDECGSKVYETSEGFPGEMVVNAGLFPPGSLPAPDREIWLRSAEKWYEPFEGASVSQKG